MFFFSFYRLLTVSLTLAFLEFFDVFSFTTVLSMVHFQEDITDYPGSNLEFYTQSAKFVLGILSITYLS